MNNAVAALVIGLAAGAAPAWWLTSDHYQGVIAKEHEAQQRNVIAAQEQHRLDLLAYANTITSSGAQHDKDSVTISNLRRKSEWLRVNFPTCPVSGAAEAGGNIGEAGRVLPNPVDALFERLRSRAGELVEEADRLNIDAIRMNARCAKVVESEKPRGE